MNSHRANATSRNVVWCCALSFFAFGLALNETIVSAQDPLDGPLISESDLSQQSQLWEESVASSASQPYAESELTVEGCEAASSSNEEELAMHWDESFIRPFDWLRHVGFRHSSTHGRHVGRGIPLERSSWLNRPFHVDWFLGPLLSDNLAPGVEQSNEVFSGLRFGWDFDYYWGIQSRFGWSDPEILTEESSVNPLSGTYFVGDIDILYYPWGDTKVRPYMLWGLGMANVGSVFPDGTGNEVTLLGMPFGAGVEFPQTPWLAWRLELLDNLAFGDDSVDTMHNVSFTAGMEIRLGARPRSYWPWRSSRKVW